MREAQRRRFARRHARVAGGLVVLALFFATTVPWSLSRLVGGEWSLSGVVYMALFAAMGLLAAHQARRWHTMRPAQPF